jgi:pilus assembly protein Flp/PilA
MVRNQVFVTTKDEVDEMKKFLVAFFKDEEGLTMVEYAVAGSLVAAAAVTAFTDLGAAIVLKIQALVTAVNS